jgi:hypothetical protein
MKRFELQPGEDIEAALYREGLYDGAAVFIFEGWPKLEGEDERPIYSVDAPEAKDYFNLMGD